MEHVVIHDFDSSYDSAAQRVSHSYNLTNKIIVKEGDPKEVSFSALVNI